MKLDALIKLMLLLVVGCTGTKSVSSGSRDQLEDGQIDLHERIRALYNFEPHLLAERQIDEKSNLLDRFWDEASKKPGAYAKSLRKELADFSNPPFFLFDGSRLLLSLSDKPEDRRIALAAVARCDLRDVQPVEYFKLVHRIAVENEDTTAAAFHILPAPGFNVIVPQHALVLGQDFSLIYMLFPADQEFWLRPSIERLGNEKDETAQKSLLLLLWYAQTAESDKAIAEFANDANKPANARDYVEELRRKNNKGIAILPWNWSTMTEAGLRNARRERMKSVSDEALIEFDSLTVKIIAKRAGSAGK